MGAEVLASDTIVRSWRECLPMSVMFSKEKGDEIDLD